MAYTGALTGTVAFFHIVARPGLCSAKDGALYVAPHTSRACAALLRKAVSA